jgi:hypothetical protein
MDNGFVFHKRHERSVGMYWNCVNIQECSGTAITRDNLSEVISTKSTVTLLTKL